MKKTAIMLTVAAYLATSNVAFAANSEFSKYLQGQGSGSQTQTSTTKQEKTELKKATKQSDQTTESGSQNQKKVEKQTQTQPQTQNSDESVAKKVMVNAKNMAKEMLKKAKELKTKAVYKAFFYEQSVLDTVNEEGRAEFDADFDAWGQMTVNMKKGKIVLNLHGVTPGEEYTLQYDGVTVATGTANEDGSAQVRGVMNEEAMNGEAWVLESFTIVTAGDEDFVAHASKVKPLPEMSSEEDGNGGEMEEGEE
jgi:hypothetical protein